MLYNAIVAGIRTGIAALVGLVITSLATAGVDLDAEVTGALTLGLFAVVTAGYNVGVNWLSVNVHPGFGYMLGIPKTPEYNEIVSDGEQVIDDDYEAIEDDVLYDDSHLEDTQPYAPFGDEDASDNR